MQKEFKSAPFRRLSLDQSRATIAQCSTALRAVTLDTECRATLALADPEDREPYSQGDRPKEAQRPDRSSPGLT